MTQREEAPAIKVALTGAAGVHRIHILTELHGHGHEVIALVRDDAQADVRHVKPL
jgi:putative NADH-flavin reductase